MTYVCMLATVAALGGLLFGYDTAVIAGAIKYIKIHFELGAVTEGWAVSNVLVGCMIGALLAGVLSDRWGRKKVLLFSAVLFAVSQTVPWMFERLGQAATFWVYAVMCAVAFVFLASSIPETKGKTLEEIERSWTR